MGLGLLAFAVSVAYWPDIPGYAAAPKWLVMALGAVVLLWNCRIRVTPAQWTGLAFLGWCLFSVLWHPVPAYGFDALIQLAMLAAIFCIASSLPDLDQMFVGLALGVSVSALLTISEWYGYVLVTQVTQYGGLFANRNLLGEAAALAVAGCAVRRLWWYLPGPVVALFFADCRGAYLGLFAALVVWLAKRVPWWTAALVVLAVIVSPIVLLHHGTLNATLRLAAWMDAFDGLTVFGRGIGSFYVAMPEYGFRLGHFGTQFAHAHNDAIELLFETGIPGFVLFAGFVALCLRGASEADRIPVAAFFAAGLVGFPLHEPVTGMVAAACAGHLCGRHDQLWRLMDYGRNDRGAVDPPRRRLRDKIVATAFRRRAVSLQSFSPAPAGSRHD